MPWTTTYYVCTRKHSVKYTRSYGKRVKIKSVLGKFSDLVKMEVPTLTLSDQSLQVKPGKATKMGRKSLDIQYNIQYT